jgi:hypothetical protein
VIILKKYTTLRSELQAPAPAETGFLTLKCDFSTLAAEIQATYSQKERLRNEKNFSARHVRHLHPSRRNFHRRLLFLRGGGKD